MQVNSINTQNFGATPKYIGKFSKQSKQYLNNIPAIKDFTGNITFVNKTGLTNSMLPLSGFCKKLQMFAEIGNKGKMLEVQSQYLSTKDTALVSKFAKMYKDSLGEIFKHLTDWASR